MWEEIFNQATTNGIWAVLFVGLLFFILTDSAKREKKYQETIAKLNSHLDCVEDIRDEIKEIRTSLIKKGDVKN
jgi:hypothetical protein